jgi:hypothetical protein
VLNWDIESALFGPTVIIVQFIWEPNCITIENLPFGFNGLCEPQSLKVSEKTGQWTVPQGLGDF